MVSPERRLLYTIGAGLSAFALTFAITHLAEGHDTGAQRIEAEVIKDIGPFAVGALEAWAIGAGIEEKDRREWEAEPSEPPKARHVRIVPRLPNANSNHPPAER